MLSRRAILALVIGGMTVVAVPGAGGEAIQEGGEDPTVIHIYATDFAFVLDRTIIPAGPVQFVLINQSEEYRHEAWIYPIDERDGPHFHEMLHLKRTGQRANEPDYIEGIVARSGELVAADATTFLAASRPVSTRSHASSGKAAATCGWFITTAACTPSSPCGHGSDAKEPRWLPPHSARSECRTAA